MEMKKGFYFSFDGLLALTLISASLFVVTQSADVNNANYQSNTIDYQKSSITGRDSMKLSSSHTFRYFDESFQDELVDKTVMQEEDLDRTILDGITLLWAARNATYARKSTKKYFDTKIPDDYGYRLQVNESGSGNVLYSTGSILEDASVVNSVSRLVSGHQIDKPSEGFQARARATSITKNETKIVAFPPLGSANEQGGKMEVRKDFYVNESEKIHNATFFLSIQYNSNNYFDQFKINGNQYGQAKFKPWLYDDGRAAYGKLDVTEDIEEGKNTLFLRMKSNDFHSHFHPGTKLEIKYRKDSNNIDFKKRKHKRIYLEDIISDNPGSDNAGVFHVEQFEIPEDAEFINATYNLKAEDLPSDCGYDPWQWWLPDYDWDVRVEFNGDVLKDTCASGTHEEEIELDEDDVQDGTNVISTYLALYNNDFWGEDRIELVSDTGDLSTSYIDLWYNRSEEDLRFGEIRVTTSDKIGGSPENPKNFDFEFDYTDVSSTRYYIAQRYSIEPEISIDDGTEDMVFDSPGSRSAPTRIYASSDYYDIDGTSEVEFYDPVGESSPLDYDFFPESTMERTVWAPSQVGYGQLYPTQEEAVENATYRLEQKLGPFVDATGISTEQVSTGDQPYIWGPASVKLVVWR